MSYERAGMGTNGKGGLPTGPMAPGELEARIDEEFVFDASGRGMRREDVARQEADAASREAASAERRADWAARLQAWNQQCETQPEQCAATMVPLCAFVSLLPGAIIGAIASPKGERWGGAKWGALASAATCPLSIATARLGAVGSLIVWGAGIAAPIAAARYRLERKRERGELPANPDEPDRDRQADLVPMYQRKYDLDFFQATQVAYEQVVYEAETGKQMAIEDFFMDVFMPRSRGR
jgi:hypothetical protein